MGETATAKIFAAEDGRIRSYLNPIFQPNTAELVEARSLLSQSQILQPNTHFAAFFEIYSRPYRAKKKCTHFSSPEKKEHLVKSEHG